MTKPPTGFLSSIPTTLAAVSKALWRAIHTLGREVLTAISTFTVRLLRSTWHAYRTVEARIASLICDILLTVYALRFFAVIVGVGIALGFWRQWLILILYILLIFVAVVFYFRTNEEDSRDADALNNRYRAWLMPILEWALRLSVAAAWTFAFYLKSSGRLSHFEFIQQSATTQRQADEAIPPKEKTDNPLAPSMSAVTVEEQQGEQGSRAVLPVTAATKVLIGHVGEVESVIFSPNGRRLASGSSDETIKLWDLASGSLLRTLHGGAIFPGDLAFSPDGRLLASGSFYKIVELWDPESGRLIRTLRGHTASVVSVVFSPDGRQLASASLDKTIKLWDPETGNLQWTIRGVDVASVVFSPDGRQLVSFGGPTISLWDSATGNLRRRLGGYNDLQSPGFSPDSRLIGFGCRDNTIKLYDPMSGRLLHTLAGHTDAITSLVFSPDGRQLASSSLDKTVKLWDPATGTLLQTLTGHTGTVWSVVFSPNGRQLASCAYEKIMLWDPRSGGLLRKLTGDKGSLGSVAFSPDGLWLASVQSAAPIKLWRLSEK